MTDIQYYKTEPFGLPPDTTLFTGELASSGAVTVAGSAMTVAEAEALFAAEMAWMVDGYAYGIAPLSGMWPGDLRAYALEVSGGVAKAVSGATQIISQDQSGILTITEAQLTEALDIPYALDFFNRVFVETLWFAGSAQPFWTNYQKTYEVGIA